MAKNNKYPHLIIKEGDIQNVIYDPKGRTKTVPRNFTEHGQLLLDGMQNIVSFHSQNTSSLGDDNLSFNIKLHENQKFQDKQRQEFLRKNKIKVNAIKNTTEAIATATISNFNNFKKKIEDYKKTNSNVTEFQYIDSIEPFRAEEKQIATIKEIIKNKDLSKKEFDIQAVLLPNLTPEEYKKIINKFKTNLETIDGNFIREPYSLTNGMVITRFKVKGEFLNNIASDDAIYRIEETGIYTFEPSELKLLESDEIKIDDSIDPATLPNVVVIDGGIDFSKRPELLPFLEDKIDYNKNKYNNFEHGTAVASRIIFGENIDVQFKTGKLIPKAKVIDACIFDAELTEDNIIEKLKYIVEKYHQKAKIFNLSVNKTSKIDQSNMSLLAYEIDALIQKYNVIFTISSGNHNLWQFVKDYSEILDDDDSLIACPAESILAMTVGAINNETDPNSLTGKDEIAPYSRIGHGFAQNEKPDIVAYGGNISVENNTNFGVTTISDSGKLVSTSGTSFAAPVVASDIAQIAMQTGIDFEKIPLLSKLLLLHSATSLWDMEGLTDEQKNLHKKVYGNGLCNLDNALQSNEHCVTFISAGTMNRLNKQRISFYIPKVLSEQTRKDAFIVKVTCLSNPPIDYKKGEEYLGAYVGASLHKLNDKGDLIDANPKKTKTGRKKWQPYQHFQNIFYKSNPGDWQLWLQLWTRWDVEDDFEVPYALAITIEDPAKKMELYSSIQNEVQNRYDVLVRPEIRVQT